MEEVVEVLKGHFIGTFFLTFLLNLFPQLGLTEAKLLYLSMLRMKR